MHIEIGGREQLNQRLRAKQLRHTQYVRTTMICIMETNCAKCYYQDFINNKKYGEP
jgi:hypothetical protein